VTQPLHLKRDIVVSKFVFPNYVNLYRYDVGDDNWRRLHGWPVAEADDDGGAAAAAEAWLAEREICSICCDEVEPGGGGGLTTQPQNH
jgi:hypothetical protein